MKRIALTVNGKQVRADVEPRTHLATSCARARD
jgi:aerobic-type carbon monoxide dehydrogenase small subunit (CoxS/CutS family)